ncbi:hypothetical protein [Psychromicrobium xiongbiense]|uniref:hypothetical protein n=1 Tax=Psychromicrobium xiongbiense TaxID=3051184 RepID=UPI0025536A6D|nr:hypothetical protein [Psychromicrobium sp. YIM S02556]
MMNRLASPAAALALLALYVAFFSWFGTKQYSFELGETLWSPLRLAALFVIAIALLSLSFLLDWEVTSRPARWPVLLVAIGLSGFLLFCFLIIAVLMADTLSLLTFTRMASPAIPLIASDLSLILAIGTRHGRGTKRNLDRPMVYIVPALTYSTLTIAALAVYANAHG